MGERNGAPLSVICLTGDVQRSGPRYISMKVLEGRRWMDRIMLVGYDLGVYRIGEGCTNHICVNTGPTARVFWRLNWNS